MEKWKGCPFFLLVYLSLLSLSYSYGLYEMSPRIVFTKQGPVQGFLGPPSAGYYHIPSYSGSPGGFNIRQLGGRPAVEIFKGLPYASPPMGPGLRYESPAPVPHRSRTEVFMANVTRPSCPRTYQEVLNRTTVPENAFKALRRTLENTVEDCLNLDIYAPFTSIYYNANTFAGDKTRATSGLAVLVYMNSHPDDEESGVFDGSSVAALGNIIVISVRYRVGVLGFLKPSYQEDVRTNFGLWDQLAALQWIKENIAEFGGDGNNISLMGYDVDATLAGLLALSPVSQAYNGLFHRLILLNGSPLAPNAINPEPLRTTHQLARALKCPPDDRAGDLAACLRSMPVPRLLSVAEKAVGAPLLVYPFSPASDGVIVPHEVSQPHPQSNSKVLEMLKKYDILVGLKEGPILPKYHQHGFKSVDIDRFVTAALKLTLKLDDDSEPTPEIKKTVKAALLSDQGYGANPPMRELLSDFLLVQPVMDFLNSHSKTGRNTFFYVFKDFDPLNLKKYDEISYIFSSSVYRWKYTGSPSHNFKLHPFVMLINLLANFVKNGDPNIIDPSDRFQSHHAWPQYNEESGRYLEIAEDVQFPSSYRRHSATFWGHTFPSIIASFANRTTVSDQGETFPRFPPFPPGRDDPAPPFPFPFDHDNNNYGPPEDDADSTALSGQSTIVLIGCLLLLLNFLCFMGLFYQRERLKKAEIQFRKRYVESRDEQEGQGDQEGIERSSSFVQTQQRNQGSTPNNGTLQSERSLKSKGKPSGSGPKPKPPHPVPKDNMSEAETENGFSPDFLGPNYDPRTKVNRWMQMQQRLSTAGDVPPPHVPPHPMYYHHQQNSPPEHVRYSQIRRDNENPYGYHPAHVEHPNPIYSPAGMIVDKSPLYQTLNHHHQQYPYAPPSPHIIGLEHLSVSVSTPPPGYPPDLGVLPHHHQPPPPPPPMKIHLSSLQRQNAFQQLSQSSGEDSRDPQTTAPKAEPELPVEFVPPLMEPYKPPSGLGSDIPYADSRATSPSIISAPAGLQIKTPPPSLPYLIKDEGEQEPNLISLQSSESSSTPTTGGGGGGGSNSNKSPTLSNKGPTKGILVNNTTSNNNNPKRSSTLIVRDLEPPNPDVDTEPKYVTVKTGTLKRSVAVDTSTDDNNTSNGNNNTNNSTTSNGASSSSSNTNEPQRNSSIISTSSTTDTDSTVVGVGGGSSTSPTSASSSSGLRVTFKETL